VCPDFHEMSQWEGQPKVAVISRNPAKDEQMGTAFGSMHGHSELCGRPPLIQFLSVNSYPNYAADSSAV
jgi:hypothetical protein